MNTEPRSPAELALERLSDVACRDPVVDFLRRLDARASSVVTVDLLRRRVGELVAAAAVPSPHVVVGAVVDGVLARWRQ